MFADREGHAALVLDGHVPHPHEPPVHPWTAAGLTGAALSVALAVLLAAAMLRHPAPHAANRNRSTLRRAASAVTARLHALHSGHIGDYAAWLTAGVAVLALLTTRW